MESILKGTLAHLSKEKLTRLLKHLSNIGIRTSDDFRFLTEDDLKQIILLIDSKYFYMHLTTEENNILQMYFVNVVKNFFCLDFQSSNAT